MARPVPQSNYTVGREGGAVELIPGTLDLDRIVREATEEDDMFTEEDRRKLDHVYQHLEAYEPLVWTTRLQRWLAKAIRSVFPNADLSGPDVETNQPFKG